MEHQNKELVDELRSLRLGWGQETKKIREKYGPKLEEQQNLLEAQDKDLSEMAVKVEAQESYVAYLRDKYLIFTLAT